MNKKTLTTLLIIAVLSLILLLAGFAFLFNKTQKQEKQISETEQYMEEEKQHMVTEIEDIAGEIDGYSLYIYNDSLLREFEDQKQKIKDLQDELQKTKATDAKKIMDLKGEIATLRKIIAHYIQQIDSLNSLNKRLTTENLEVKQRYQSVSETAQVLAMEKEELSETVSRAAILELYNFSFTPLDRRQKATDRAKRMEMLKFGFTIGKNITAEPGNKTVFLRLTRPDGEVMMKANTTFSYENKNIAYSLSKNFEYGGEAYSDALYWNVEEVLQLGNYQADFFVDGNRVGSFKFRIDKN